MSGLGLKFDREADAWQFCGALKGERDFTGQTDGSGRQEAEETIPPTTETLEKL